MGKNSLSKNTASNLLLIVRNLFVFYDSIKALDNVNFTVNQGEIVAMIGPNGAGKSTVLKAISGLLNPQSGEILFQGEKINGRQPYQLVEKGISLVPEGRRVFTSMTVLENLEMGAFTVSSGQLSVISGQKVSTKNEIRERIENVFSLFPILKKRQKQKAGTLSSGEQQMLAIGRALMLKPKLLLLDEPSLGLSPNFVEIVFNKIKEINKNATTILLVEQNARMALEHADRGYVFEFGKIGFEGKVQNLLNSELIIKSFLGI